MPQVTIDELKPQDFILSNKLDDVMHEPFCAFQTASYLPMEVYQSLKDFYPADSWFIKVEDSGGHKMALNSHFQTEQFEKFLASCPVWSKFVNSLRSDVFVKDFYKFFKKDIEKAHPGRGKKTWCSVSDGTYEKYKNDKSVQPIEVQFVFSRMIKGGKSTPHTDSVRKLATLLMYFPEKDWDLAYGGGTEFYRPKHFIDNYNYGNGYGANYDELETIKVALPTPNRLAGFIKSRNSWHGVRPVQCPDGKMRKAMFVQFVATDVVPGQASPYEKVEYHFNKLVRSLGPKRDTSKTDYVKP